MPQTRLEAFDTNTDTIILRATVDIGTVTTGGGTLSVKCRSITDVNTGRRELGLVLETSQAVVPEQIAFIDLEEIDSLRNALEYLGKLDWTVTDLPSFDAAFTSKGGFRVVAYGSRRSGGIEYAVRNIRFSPIPLRLTRDQIGQFRGFLNQAKAKLDTIQKGQ